MARVALRAQAEFGIEMCVALVPVTEVRAAAQDVRVARFQVSYGVDYAMFDGGGMNWAETVMKADDHVHFIDGGAGGYTLAAVRMKGRSGV